MELPINIVEATLGCKKDVPLMKESIVLNIPEGTQNGDKHRIKGKVFHTLTHQKLETCILL